MIDLGQLIPAFIFAGWISAVFVLPNGSLQTLSKCCKTSLTCFHSWLCVSYRTDSNVLLLVYKSLSGQNTSPICLKNMNPVGPLVLWEAVNLKCLEPKPNTMLDSAIMLAVILNAPQFQSLSDLNWRLLYSPSPLIDYIRCCTCMSLIIFGDIYHCTVLLLYFV